MAIRSAETGNLVVDSGREVNSMLSALQIELMDFFLQAFVGGIEWKTKNPFTMICIYYRAAQDSSSGESGANVVSMHATLY